MSFDRRQKILEILKEKGAVSLKELEQTFTEVSSMTLRRDLEYFEATGQAIRVKGGLRAAEERSGIMREDVYDLRLAKNRSAKDMIATIALEYLEPGRSIFFDSGTTILALAKLVPDLHLSVLTSGPGVALELSKRYSLAVNLIGGVLNRETLSVSGNQSLEFVENLNFELAFMVTSAISAEPGFTCGNYNEAQLKNRIIQKAKKKIMLVDSSKFERTMPFTFAALSDVDVIITDKKPSEEILEAAKSAGVLIRFK